MWPNPQETADLVTFTEEIRNGKIYFLCSDPENDVAYENKRVLNISYPLLSEFERMNQLLFPLKSSENLGGMKDK